MISYKEKSTQLRTLHITFDGVAKLDELINEYSRDVPGPAYITAKFGGYDQGIDLQIDRKIFVVALQAQRTELIDYLYELGIDYDG